MLDLGSGVAGGARGWVAGRAGLWGVPPTRVWVVGFSPLILEHPTSISDTGVNLQLSVSSSLNRTYVRRHEPMFSSTANLVLLP